MAIRARNLLHNGMGGISWAGLPLVAAHIGVTDMQGFVDALEVLVTHQPSADMAADGAADRKD